MGVRDRRMPVMKRRFFLKTASVATLGMTLPRWPAPAEESGRERVISVAEGMDPALLRDWRRQWEHKILRVAKTRSCDREVGEEIGWLVSPLLDGFYYGYLATGQVQWVEHLADWADSWIRRGVQEPDGFIGWPKLDSEGFLGEEFLADSLLGEAMALRPVVLMAAEIARNSALQPQFGARADQWLKVAGQLFEKWDSRGCWREIKDGGVWVVPAFGVDPKTGKWTQGYERRIGEGFPNPANKQNHVARWLLAMHDVTKKSVYRERAEKWFRRMRSKMKTRVGGKYFVWNYWDPAGPWDYKSGGGTRHWVGVHPNGGYYAIDVSGIVAAFEHDLVFTHEDIQRLVATNRDFMWNQKLEDAKFQRIDGGLFDLRWKSSPGVLWTALAPYDKTLRAIFLSNHDPGSWSGMVTTPWFIALEAGKSPKSSSERPQ
jgi:hypothetical protein